MRRERWYVALVRTVLVCYCSLQMRVAAEESSLILEVRTVSNALTLPPVSLSACCHSSYSKATWRCGQNQQQKPRPRNSLAFPSLAPL